MLENQESKLPDATENQPSDTEKSEINENKITEESQVEPVDKTEDTTNDEQQPVEDVQVKEESVDPEEKKEEVTPETVSDDGTKSAVDEVEKHVAEKSENLHEVPEVPMEDYKGLDLDAIVSTIENLMQSHPIQAISKHVEVLKKVFNQKFGKLLTEAKTKFLEEGGNTIDFHFDNPVQKQYNKVLLDYKKARQKYYKELETKYQENLLRKQAIIERLKELIENGEASSMYKKFQAIQEEWRSVGPVAREYYTDLWRTYHFHVERFYDLLHLSNDLRDLDFKHNLEKKLKLVERAEALAESPKVKAAFDELQILHRMWKEEIGPVSRKYREEIWERFSNATKKIHDKRHDLFNEMKEKYEENLQKKEAVIEEIASIDTSANKTHNDWQKSINRINDLRKQFFDIGRVPRSKNEIIWQKFKEATKLFNQKKNSFYKEIKREQQENLDKKMKLVEQAESLRDSDDWDNVTEVMKRIQAEWKTIGHVPRKHSDKIWNRFKEACNYFFDRLHNKQDEVDEEKMAIYVQKKEYLEKLKQEAEKEDFKPDLSALKKYIKEWREMGSVPKSQRYIDAKFNKFLDPFFEKLSLNKAESTMLRYRNQIDSLVEQQDVRKIENEGQFVRKKLETVTKEKQQLENNMQFFSNADDSNPMIKNIKKNLKVLEDEMELWKAKLQYLRSLDS
jgi:hypothetical protein